MTYEYVSVRVILGSSIFWFEFNSGKIESGRNQIGFKTGMVQVGFGLSIFSSLQVRSQRSGFELGQVILGVGHFGCGSISGFVRLWIGLCQVFGSKSVQPISGVGSGMDQGQSVRVSGQFCQV